MMCRKLKTKGLYTFHGLVGYCMKDVGKVHFTTMDHNVSAEDTNLGLEQYALQGQEENLVQCVFMCKKSNYKHPLVVDFDGDLYQMLKTGKYVPTTTAGS